MASRFWVGGSGNWSDNTNHWSASSGGAGGASLPTSSDNVFIDTSAGLGAGGTITLDVDGNCNNFTSTVGHDFHLAQVANVLNIYGSGTFESHNIFDSGTQVNFKSTTTGKTITNNGCSFYFVDFLGLGGGWTLQDNMTCANELYMENGTLTANGYNVTAHDFYWFADTGFTPTINMGSGTWTITSNDVSAPSGVWVVDEIAATVTFNPSTSTIKLTDATANSKTFALAESGVGKTYNNIWFTGTGSGSYKIQGTNTFNNFKDDNSVAHSIIFTHGTTQTVTTFTVSGAAGNLITINSDTTATHALVKNTGGVISCDYLNIQHSVVTPITTWYAGTHSTNNQNVATMGSGWTFTAAPVVSTISAPRDANRVTTIMGTSSIDGLSPALVYVNASHYLNIDDNATGLSVTSVNAERDQNRIPVMWGTSSSDGTTPIPIYIDVNNSLLVNSQ